MTRSLARRLERLETQAKPAAEPQFLQIEIVDSDGSVRDGPLLVLGSGGRLPSRSTLSGNGALAQRNRENSGTA
jgi:hypothetical protein